MSEQDYFNQFSEPEEPDYRLARGITGWEEGDEPAEVTIRRVREAENEAHADYDLLHVILNDELGLPVDAMTLHDMLEALQKALVEARRWRKALQSIADADGHEGNVHGSLRWIEGFGAGVAAQGERAKKALGQVYKEQMPENILLWRIETLEAENVQMSVRLGDIAMHGVKKCTCCAIYYTENKSGICNKCASGGGCLPPCE